MFVLYVSGVATPVLAVQRTATTSGNWNNTATWGGNPVPGDTDDAVIPTGITVTVTANQTIGNSGANGTVAIALTGTLTVNAVLTLRGDISITQPGTVNVSRVGTNTGGLTFDPPAGVTYRIITVLGGSGTSQVNFTGEVGDYVPVTTSLARTGNRAYFNLTDPPPNLNWDYVWFTEMGGTGDTTATRFLSYTGVSGSSVTIDYMRTSSNVGKMNFDFSSVNNFTFDMRNSDMRGPRSADFLHITADTARVSGTRQIKDCTFYRATSASVILYARDFTVDGGVYANTKIVGDLYDRANTYQNLTSIWDVAVNGMITGFYNAAHVVQDSAFLVATALVNPHYLNFITADGTSTATVVQRNVVDGFGGVNDGDFAIAVGNATVTRNILINNAGVLHPGNEPGLILTVTRNTLNGTAHANVGETAGAATQIARWSSNLVTNQAAGLLQDAAFVSQSGLNLDYNGAYNLSTGTNFDIGGNNGYLGAASVNPWWTAGSYGDDNKGLHDIYGDPQYVDASRTAITWYNSVFGAGGSFANVRAEMVKLNGTDLNGAAATFTPGATTAALVAYIRGGFTPTNSIYDGTGDPDDGSPDIGAVDFTTSGGIQPNRFLLIGIGARR